MKQAGFSDVEYGLRKRATKREEFLKAMGEFIPWEEWVAYIEPYYPSGRRGRPPIGIEKMLRMYLLQCWFNLSDEGAVVYGDAGYLGIEKREEIVSDARLSSIEYRINRRAGSVRKAPNHLPGYEKRIERRKSSIRSKVEHPFLIIKRFFGYSKTVYRGLAKNTHRLHMLFTSANLLMRIRAGRPPPA
ncbi:MAG: transposase [Desulfovibrio sp.]|nr:transposase [Desulfovibrio sp.]